MLRVTTIHASSAAASARYYTRYLTADGPDAEGRWVGNRAFLMGIDGTVETDALEAILSGHDPFTGVQLGSALRDRADKKGRVIQAVAGYDATFSAPKSLSVWWGLTGDPGLLAAHNTAVAAVLTHVERYGATTRIRAGDRRAHPEVDGLIMAVFPQATSREDDPQLHSHVVVSGKVLAPDGRWLALDGHYLKKKQRALGGLYQSVLRAELSSRYGVAWGPIENGQAEIEGVPVELLDAFSKRTAQVDECLAEKVDEFRQREGRDPTRWERAALTREAAQDTRQTKTHLSPDQLSGHWRDQAHELGWTPERLTVAVRESGQRLTAPEPLVLGAVVDQLSTRGSTWTRADVLQAVCDQAVPVPGITGDRWAAIVESACDRVVDACRSVDSETRGPRRASDGRSIWLSPIESHLTTDGVLAQEERILTYALEAQDTPAQPSATIEREGLDVMQAHAAAAVAGHDPLVLVVGPAGTGKTTMLRVAAEDLRTNQRQVFAVAPTAKAAKVLLDETGIASATVAKLLHEWRRPEPSRDCRLPASSTLIVDEAGMLGTGNLDELTRLATARRWRLVLVGDPRQLHAVGRGGMFDELCRTGRVHQLATIHRFRHAWERQASLHLRVGNADALDQYFQHHRVAAGTFDSITADIAQQWLELTDAGRTVAVVAETNDHVDALNRAIQTARRARRGLGPATTRIAGGEAVNVGDIVVTRRNDRRITTDRQESVRNRDRWTVRAVGPNGSLTVSHEHGHGTAVLPADYVGEHVRLGYAATAHGHQGDTVDVSLTVITAATTHRSLYVGATRGRDANQLLVVTDQPDQARDILEQVLTNDRVDVPAVSQRRYLEQHEQRDRRQTAERIADAAERAAREALRQAAPFLGALNDAERAVDDIKLDLSDARRAVQDLPVWRRRAGRAAVASLEERLAEAVGAVSTVRDEVAPYLDDAEVAQARARSAREALSRARLQERLDAVGRDAPDRSIERGVGIEL